MMAGTSFSYRDSPIALVFRDLEDCPLIPESFWDVELRRFLIESCDALAISSVQRAEDLSHFVTVVELNATPIGCVEVQSARYATRDAATCCLFSVEEVGAHVMDAGVGGWGATIDEPPSELFFFSGSDLVLSSVPAEDSIVLYRPRSPSVRSMLSALPSDGFTLVQLDGLKVEVRIRGTEGRA